MAGEPVGYLGADAVRDLYQRAGFNTEGTLRAHFRRRNGELWDAIIVSRLL
ncbi:hypothetical protein [Nocardia sp. XZ_19_369]|uniref:hypothetical protein n=1 Tax=Nocardia sp. XZ_19_369 TaxID=2769487 RepID=UPI00189029CF|nr:hypothetical protein [Nocardia sp. XZ_19_369]